MFREPHEIAFFQHAQRQIRKITSIALRERFFNEYFIGGTFEPHEQTLLGYSPPDFPSPPLFLFPECVFLFYLSCQKTRVFLIYILPLFSPKIFPPRYIGTTLFKLTYYIYIYNLSVYMEANE